MLSDYARSIWLSRPLDLKRRFEDIDQSSRRIYFNIRMAAIFENHLTRSSTFLNHIDCNASKCVYYCNIIINVKGVRMYDSKNMNLT